MKFDAADYAPEMIYVLCEINKIQHSAETAIRVYVAAFFHDFIVELASYFQPFWGVHDVFRRYMCLGAWGIGGRRCAQQS
jgi:hypothetical protein